VKRSTRGFTIIELMVGSAVTFVTVLAVTAAFLGYTQAFHVQAGIRGGQASLRQTHQLVVRNLRMAGYGMEPWRAFDLPPNWNTDPLRHELAFRMRNPRFNARVSALTTSTLSLSAGLSEPLLRGQILQVLCPGAVVWSYAQLKTDAPVGAMLLELEAPSGTFPRLNEFSSSCFKALGGGAVVHLYKIDVYHYSIHEIDEDANPATLGRPYLFRRHGLAEQDSNAFGEPVAEDIEALRVVFLRDDGTSFVPDLSAAAPDYDTPLADARRKSDHPGNIRAVRLGLVARTSTRDSGVGPDRLDAIPPFADLTAPTQLPAELAGFRRLVSEVTVPIRNMYSSEMFVPIYSKDSAPGACNGSLPADEFNCAGG